MTIIELNGKFVLVQETHPKIVGKWNLPGGALEESENLISCAKREATEETGFKVKPLYLVGVYTQISLGILLFVFKSEIVSGKLTISEDLSDVKWFSLREIENLEKENQLSFPYVLQAIRDYKAGKKFALDIISL